MFSFYHPDIIATTLSLNNLPSRYNPTIPWNNAKNILLGEFVSMDRIGSWGAVQDDWPQTVSSWLSRTFSVSGLSEGQNNCATGRQHSDYDKNNIIINNNNTIHTQLLILLPDVALNNDDEPATVQPRSLFNKKSHVISLFISSPQLPLQESLSTFHLHLPPTSTAYKHQLMQTPSSQSITKPLRAHTNSRHEKPLPKQPP
jgi:hypothetical protein